MMGKSQSAVALKRITSNRERHNILYCPEQKTLAYLCQKMPSWVNSDMLTTIGLMGSIIVTLGLYLATFHKAALFISIIGFAIQWFGDSLDGRLAYYRNTPRKWYGWALDINVDWISISIIGIGFYFYLPEFKFLALIFVTAYGGSMVLSLLRYKINGKYIIDKGLLGPTEMRIILCLVIVIEYFYTGPILLFSIVGSFIIIIMNAKELKDILDLGDERDLKERHS